MKDVINLLLSIPIGILAGLYSGLIVTRYVRFAELRNEALRIVRSIRYSQEQSKIVISDNEDVSKLILVSSDLFFLKHKKAADMVNLLSSQITEASYKAGYGQIDFAEYDKLISDCQFLARDLRANKTVLWSLWGRL